MPPTRYPAATWKGDGQSGGSWTDGPYRVVLHTTETRTTPGYQAGATAPHLTYHPAARTWTQHTALDRAARALRNEAGGVETNRRRAIQVEIVCYSDRATAERVHGTWVGDLTGVAYDDLAAFLRWCGTEFGVEATWPGRTARSYSEANAAGFRLTPASWDAFGGVCAHQHVPENSHWDTGALDIPRLINLMDQEDDDMPLTKAEIDAIAKAVWDHRIDKLDQTAPNKRPLSAHMLRLVHAAGIQANATNRAILSAVEKIPGVDTAVLAAAIADELDVDLSKLPAKTAKAVLDEFARRTAD